jgi:predicted nucleic acid-binding protein
MKKVLLDTNIIIDALSQRKPFNEAANSISDLIVTDIIEGYITASSVTDIYYLLSKEIGEDAGRQEIEKILNLFQVWITSLPVIKNFAITQKP